MENRIPLPTDNIFKFYALFGLLLFVVGWVLAIQSMNSHNDFFFKSFVKMEEHKAIPSPTPADQMRLKMQEKEIEIAIANKEFYKWANALITVFGFLAMVYGFKTWHTRIQPLQDEILVLQKKKLELEIQAMEAKRTA
jgi:hypothetical protein